MQDLLAAVRNRFPATLFILALLFFWEALVHLLEVPSYLLPAPSAVLSSLAGSMGPLIAVHSRTTLIQAAIGLTMALSAGVAAGGLVHHFPWARRMFYPLLVVSQTIPVIVLAPLLVIWFGYGMLPKLIVVTLACFFPIAVAVVDGLDGADPKKLKLLRSMGAGPAQQFRLVKVPTALVSLFTGLRVAATYGVMASVIAEWMGADAGLGVYIVRSARSFRTDQVFAGILLITLYSVGLFQLVDLLRRKALPWERYERESPAGNLPHKTEVGQNII